MTIKEMRQRLATQKRRGLAATAEYNALVAKLEAAHDDADKAKADALAAELDALETECVDLSAKIEAHDKAARRAGLFASTAAGPYQPARTVGEPNPETTGGFRNLAEFAVAVRSASPGSSQTPDQRLFAAAPSNPQVNQGSSGEGFLVPPDFSQAIWDLVFPGYGFDLMDLMTASPTGANMVQLVKDETTPWGATGVQAYWRAEAQAMTRSKISLNGAIVPLHEIYAFVEASQELLDDAPQLNDRLTRKAALAIRYQVSKSLFQGSGNGQPLGFLNGPSTVVQNKESGQAAATFVLNNAAKMMTRLPAASIPNSIWLANVELLPQLIGLNIGTWPVWLPSNGGAMDAPGGRLLGRPIVFSEQALPLGTSGDIMLIDPAGYFLTNKAGAGGGISFATSIHLFFDFNATAFRWIFRIGGQPLLSAPIAPANGTLTKSHFVALQAR